MAMAASHCGTLSPAGGPSQSRKRQRTMSGTFTTASLRRRTLRTRRGLSRKAWMKFFSDGCLILQAAELMRLERKERGLQAREKRGEEDERRDNRQENDEAGRGHSAPRRRFAPAIPLREIKACRFAPHLRRPQNKAKMSKGERISRFVAELARPPRRRSAATDRTMDGPRDRLRSIPVTAVSSAAGTSSATTKRTTFWSISGWRRRRTTGPISKA